MIVRKDLDPTQQAVQACHAAIEAARILSPDAAHPHLALLGAKSQHQLKSTLYRLQQANIPAFPFYEPDRDNELTAVAAGPVSGEDRKFFKRFNCLNLAVADTAALSFSTGETP